MDYAIKLLEFVVEHWEEIAGIAAVLAGLAVELARKWKDVRWVAEKLGL
jgi:hypothetical protein